MDKTYTTKLGDTWDVISFLMYGSEIFVQELVTANWEYRDVGIFGGGAMLKIPQITAMQRDNANLPLWRRDVE